jgi:hypothetical protein
MHDSRYRIQNVMQFLLYYHQNKSQKVFEYRTGNSREKKTEDSEGVGRRRDFEYPIANKEPQN